MTDTSLSSTVASITGMFIIFLLLSVPILALTIWAWWKIFVKAGYQGALSLLMLVPGANLVMFFIFAFQEWPSKKSDLAKKQ